jgi:hypothetical protein
MTIEFVRFQRPASWASVARSRQLLASSEGQVWKTPSITRVNGWFLTIG